MGEEGLLYPFHYSPSFQHPKFMHVLLFLNLVQFGIEQASVS